MMSISEIKPEDDELVSVKSLAAALGVSPATIWRMVKAKHIPEPVKISEGCTRFYKKRTLAMIAARATQNNAA